MKYPQIGRASQGASFGRHRAEVAENAKAEKNLSREAGQRFRGRLGAPRQAAINKLIVLSSE
jgi:hypothetical protein